MWVTRGVVRARLSPANQKAYVPSLPPPLCVCVYVCRFFTLDQPGRTRLNTDRRSTPAALENTVTLRGRGIFGRVGGSLFHAERAKSRRRLEC